MCTLQLYKKLELQNVCLYINNAKNLFAINFCLFGGMVNSSMNGTQLGFCS